MKKILTMFVLLMFLASNLAVAFADDVGSVSNAKEDDVTAENGADSGDSVESLVTAENDAGSGDSVESLIAPSPSAKIDKGKECIQSCKGNQGEDCEKRCGGLVKIIEEARPTERIQSIKNNLDKIEAKRLEVLGEEEVVKIESLSQAELKKLANLDRARLKEIAKLNSQQLKDHLKDLKLVKVSEDKLAKKRIILEEKIKKLNEKFEKAKENFMKNENAYKQRRSEFLDAKKKLAECKGKDTEECKKLNDEAIAKGKAFLTSTANLLIEHLNKIKAKVEASENIEEAEANEMLQKIDVAIAELEAAKTNVDAAKTKGELQEAAKTINRAWKMIKYKSMEYAARIVNARVGEIIKRSENLESKMQCAVAEMKEQGKPTDEIDKLIEEFSNGINSAREHYNKAKDLLKQAREIKVTTDPSDERAAEIKQLIEDAKKEFNNAHKKLKEAHETLKQAVKKVKDSGVDIGSCKPEELKADEVYIVEDASEETIGEVVESLSSTGSAEQSISEGASE